MKRASLKKMVVIAMSAVIAVSGILGVTGVFSKKDVCEYCGTTHGPHSDEDSVQSGISDIAIEFFEIAKEIERVIRDFKSTGDTNEDYIHQVNMLYGCLNNLSLYMFRNSDDKLLRRAALDMISFQKGKIAELQGMLDKDD